MSTTKTRTAQHTPIKKTSTWPKRHRPKHNPSSHSQQRQEQRSQISLGRLDEAFQVECDPTMGVELEFFLLDQLTGEPAPIFDKVYRRLPAEIQTDTINEFLKCQIEYRTPVCRDADECRLYLQRFVDAASDAARAERASLLWRATLEDWPFDPALVYDCPRSHANLRRLGDKAHLLSTCGMHVHVAVPRDKAISVVDRVQSIIPDVVRQSANSPTMHGRVEELASHRAKIWGCEFPMLTYPHYFGDWKRFRTQVARLSRFGKIRQPKDLYMLARPTSLGTVELRAADLPQDLDTVIKIADQIQAKVIDCQSETARLPSLQSLWARYQDAYRGEKLNLKTAS